MNRVIDWLLDSLFPARCPFCQNLLQPGEKGMCDACQPRLPWVTRPLETVDFCDGFAAPLYYREGVRRAVVTMKFHQGALYIDYLGELMSQALNDQWHEPVDLIVWVPLSARHYRRRGFDQAELLARRVGSLRGIPVVSALKKVRNTKTQSRLKDHAARRANVLGAYRVKKGVDLRGKRVVLVDDVVTSGASVSECAACLRMAGAQSVVALSIAAAR